MLHRRLTRSAQTGVGDKTSMAPHGTTKADIIRLVFIQKAVCDPFVGTSFGPAAVIQTVDPAVVDHILRNNFENYVKGDWFQQNMDPILGHGIFAVDGWQWRRTRKLSSNIFTGSVAIAILLSVDHEN